MSIRSTLAAQYGAAYPSPRPPAVTRAFRSVRRFFAELYHEDVRGPSNLPRNGAFK